ncbi:MAG TPA: ribokinase [Chloroflexota bacterium]
MIAVVGSLNMDLIARVNRLPMPGETLLARELVQAPGGKGANQALAAARAGSSVEFVGRVGDDAAGAALLANLTAAGVETRHVTVDASAPTGTALIAVDDGGANTIIVAAGVNANLTPNDVEAAREVIAWSNLLLLQLETPLETVQYAAELAHVSGTRIVLNPSPAQALPPSLLRLVDILVPNEEEVAYLSGMGSPVDPASAAGMLRANGARAVVITMGDRGASIVNVDGETDISAHEVGAVDTTGAGDAFVGNLAAALDEGCSLEDAARFASAAAAISVQRSGAQPSMPTRHETEALLAGQVSS